MSETTDGGTVHDPDEIIAAHVALREVLLPRNGTGLMHKGPGLIASTADIDCATCNTIYVHTGEASERELERLLRAFTGREVPFHLNVRASLADRYAAIASEAGLIHLTDLPMMAVTPAAFRPAAPVATLDLKTLPADASSFHLDLVAQGLGMSREGLGYLMSPENLSSPAWTTYVGEVDGELAVTGSSIDGPAGTGLISIVTDPRFARQGFAATLTSAAIADSFARGQPVVFLHSSPQGFGVYERLGFDIVEHLSIFGRATDSH